MSWDVMVMRFPASVQAYADVANAEDDPRLPLGTLADVQALISSVFSSTDWRDPIWGRWLGDEGSAEFNIGTDEDPAAVLGFMMHVRAADEIVARILALTALQGWVALDLSTMEFLADPADTRGLTGWRNLRDNAVNPDG